MILIRPFSEEGEDEVKSATPNNCFGRKIRWGAEVGGSNGNKYSQQSISNIGGAENIYRLGRVARKTEND